MKQSFRAYLLPVFPAAAGALGLLLRLWLYSAIDEKGLLPAKHIADTLLYILTAVAMGVLFPASRKQNTRSGRKGYFGTLGCVMGALGLLCSGFSFFLDSTQRFSGIAAASCIVGCLSLLAMAVLTFSRKQISYGLFTVLTICLTMNTIANCQTWGTVSQLQEYFFPFMASIFLVLSAYHSTFLAAGQGKPEHLVFFSQGAVFFCCICLNTAHWPMYLGMLVWSASLLYSCPAKQKEA